MSLKTIRVIEEVIKTPGGDFSVRGLTPADVSVLIYNHHDALSDLFNRLLGREGNSADSLGSALIAESPQIVAEIIALASGENDADAVSLAMQLPVSIQVEALEKIGKLTFRSEDDVKKTTALIISLMKGANDILAARLPSTSGGSL